MEIFKTSLGIIASLLSIYSFYLSRKSDKKIKELNKILIDNNITTKNLNKRSHKGNFNKTATSGKGGTSIVGNDNTVTKEKDYNQ